MVEMINEFLFVRGKVDALPNDLEMPPEWALSAARWIGEHLTRTLTTEGITCEPRAALEEAIGRYEALLGYITQVSADEADDDDVKRVTTKLHKFTLGIVDRESLHGLKKLNADLEKVLPPIGVTQVIENNRRNRRGISSVVDQDGELQVLKTAQLEIYYCVWFCWPKLLEMMPSITARKLQKWLSTDFGIFTSEETVEIVYSKLKLASFKSANP